MADLLRPMDGRMHDRVSTTASGLIVLVAFAALAVSAIVYALASAVTRAVP